VWPAADRPGIHPHMLRHSNYLGHKSIQRTVRYSEFSPDRFRDFWKD
jgi:type 1 fimbriae regulatory protein FimB/type 1 fimbriae regulatory protein FimE